MRRFWQRGLAIPEHLLSPLKESHHRVDERISLHCTRFVGSEPCQRHRMARVPRPALFRVEKRCIFSTVHGFLLYSNALSTLVNTGLSSNRHLQVEVSVLTDDGIKICEMLFLRCSAFNTAPGCDQFFARLDG